MSANVLFQSLEMGAWTLPNRVLMAPLTRARAQEPGDIPWEMNVEYYKQRASAGLIISEATQISPQGKGYSLTPGIYSEEQISGWKNITGAVHAAGGTIILQLWHVGRISHPEHQLNDELPVAPSAIQPEAKTFINNYAEMVDIPTPRALELSEIPGVVEQYRQAAENAKTAGFDGVQIHGANGYLIDQFLRDGSNKRTDEYGGSIENRLRFPLEVVSAVAGVWGGDKVSVRISPTGAFNDMSDSDPLALFNAFAEGLNKFNLAFLEVVEGFPRAEVSEEQVKISHALRETFKGKLVLNGGYTEESAKAAIEENRADAVSFGKLFISNPDLPKRFEKGLDLTPPDENTFYGGDAKGYTDYPFAD